MKMGEVTQFLLGYMIGKRADPILKLGWQEVFEEGRSRFKLEPNTTVGEMYQAAVFNRDASYNGECYIGHTDEECELLTLGKLLRRGSV